MVAVVEPTGCFEATHAFHETSPARWLNKEIVEFCRLLRANRLYDLGPRSILFTRPVDRNTRTAQPLESRYCWSADSATDRVKVECRGSRGYACATSATACVSAYMHADAMMMHATSEKRTRCAVNLPSFLTRFVALFFLSSTRLSVSPKCPFLSLRR